MPPRKNPRPTNQTQLPPPPPPLINPYMLQAEIAAVVAAAMEQVNSQGTSGAGSGTTNPDPGDGQGRSRECSYKDFSNGKPTTFNGSGGVITLMQ